MPGKEPPPPSREPDEYDACLHGYIAGATAWAVWKEKAEALERALVECYAQLDNENCPMAIRFLNIGQIIEVTLNRHNPAALQSFNQNKVK